LQKKIDEEIKKAKANAVSNKTGERCACVGSPLLTTHMQVATEALRRKKVHESDMSRLAGTRLQLEMQVNTLESANLNAETMAAMKKASEALGHIHGNLYAPTYDLWRFFLIFNITCRTMDKVDATMNKVNEQRELANEIADAISNPMYGSTDVDEVSVVSLNILSVLFTPGCYRTT
jgi:charged multivesicular body protein 4